MQKDYIKWATRNMDENEDVFVVNNFLKSWSHKFIYDFNVLKKSLEKVGFINITRFDVGQSTAPNLIGLEAHGKFIGEEFNRLETFVIEGTRPNK